MSEPIPPKHDPESVVLKASPRRVVRFKRRLLIGIAAISCMAVAGVAWVALKGAHFTSGSEANLLDTGNKAKPDDLASLPSNYGEIPKPKPQLGPPLPGDLGPGIVRRERQLGLNPVAANSNDEAERAEQERLAQQAEQAREAGVFFQLNQAPGNGGGAIAGSAGGASDNAATGVGVTLAPVAAGSSGADAGHLNLNLASDQNDQQRKMDFVNQASAKDIYNDHALQTPASPYEVLAGTVIAASLLTGLNSDLPGEVTAQVTENVYDTVTGRYLLIPQGSRLIGSYDSVVAFGQSRALVAWQRIVMPDGSSIQIDNLPATDAAGYSGLKDQVDYHTWTLLKGIAMSTLLGVGTQATFGSDNNDLVEAIQESAQESTNQAGQRIVEKDLNIQPTIIVRPGWPLRVIVHKDLTLRPYQG
ncbi:MAG TPA: TrbI/VirB10 family protein [Acidisoma sp.]|jgi:type IV secretion system protein VirB10|uniref:TrbI/VirB10 family protein n=1 Tax=Acidisoma sp. TaxID=1872115 RepID=UPI002BF2A58F|nr:TrbI/VirB10 family protein [Acidisoma sp.]HTI00676.1 TrbI/VirB10 family protein [Acidisoma sp.]